MKYLFIGFLCLILQPLNGQQIECLVWNIRYASPHDGPDRWELRRDEVIGAMASRHPAIISLQEVLHSQLQDILNGMTVYKYIGIGRDDGHTKGEFSPVLYDTSRVKLLQQGNFWLSETPEKVSVGWDALLPRICTFGKFELIENGKIFWVFNTHFDHIGSQARLESARLIKTQIQYLTKEYEALILTGDLNSEPHEAAIISLNEILNDAFLSFSESGDFIEGTYSSFNPEFMPVKRIDYLFFRNLKLTEFQHLNQKRSNQRNMSDHLAVWGILKP